MRMKEDYKNEFPILFTVQCINSKGSGYYDWNMKRKYLNEGTKYEVVTEGTYRYFIRSVRDKHILGWHIKENFDKL